MKIRTNSRPSARCTTLLILVLAWLLGPVPGQVRAMSQQEMAGGRTDANSHSVIYHTADGDYRIGSGDVIEIKIDKAPELSGTFQVPSSGSITMPYLGKVKAVGETTEELSSAIASGLRGRYLKSPIVMVNVTQYRSRSFFIQGAVKNPGVYQIDGRPPLLKLITIAGGLAPEHGATAFVIREAKSEKPPDAGGATVRPVNAKSGLDGEKGNEPETVSDRPGQYDLIKVNIAGLFKGNFDQDVLIQPGDIVNIPPTDVFFVAGEVRQPGSFPLNLGTTLRQAISMAQGTTFKAATSNGIIFREDPLTGTQREIHVDISAIMRGKKPDIPIVANDIIVVPNSRIKSVASVLLMGIGGSNAFSTVNMVRIPTPTRY